MPRVYLSDTFRVLDNGAGKAVFEWYNSSTGNWVEVVRWAQSTGNVELTGDRTLNFTITKDIPKVILSGTETGTVTISARENAGKLVFRDEDSGTDVIQFDCVTGNVEALGNYTINPTVNKSTPAVILDGTETGAKTLSVRENGGVTEIYDVGSGATVMTLESHGARHASGGADAISGLAASQMSAGTIKVVVPIQIADSKQSGLDATATGVKWASDFVQKLDPQNIGSVTIRASWSASATDSVTAIEVYDETATTVLGSVSGNTGTNAEGAVSGFTAGNAVVVRANVTTASASTTATTGVVYAVLEITYAIS